jgi:AraC-like DNA-binding protein
MHRTLEMMGIAVERSPQGVALRFQTQTERALIVVEGQWSSVPWPSERGAQLPAGTLLVEFGSSTDASARRCTLDLCTASNDSSLALCFELLRQELRATPVDQRVLRALCEVVVGLAERKSDLAVGHEDSARARPAAARDLCVRKALTLLASRLSERWTVERLARELGLSRAALARRFSSATGTSPLRYLQAQRIAEAERLLSNSDLTLSEIARRVGYESEFAFSRAFKRLRGVAPGQFRRSLGVGRGPLMALCA